MEPVDDLKLAREGDERVTPIELIFDVVFVLAFSEVTAFLVREQSWTGLLQAMIIIALLWRGWFGFAWLTSVTDPESTAVRTAIFGAMSAFAVMALIIPQAFGKQVSANHDELLVFGFVYAYGVIRAVHLYLGLRASKGDRFVRPSVIRTSIGGLIAIVLLLIGCVTGPTVAGYVLWILAVIADYSFAFIFTRFRWRLVPSRFAERHGLIVIIALGETVLAAGAGAEAADVNDPPTLALAVVAVALLASLWGAYFDGTQIAAEQALLAAQPGKQQNDLARRAYSLLHFPLVMGAVLIAIGPKSAIAHPAEPFDSYVASAFFGGLAMFLLGHVGFEYISTKRLNVPRLVLGLVMIPMIAFGTARPAWESLVFASLTLALVVTPQRILGKRFSA